MSEVTIPAAKIPKPRVSQALKNPITDFPKPEKIPLSMRMWRPPFNLSAQELIIYTPVCQVGLVEMGKFAIMTSNDG